MNITKKIKAKTLFATHYHELSELEDKMDCIKNFRILIKESGDKITFLRKIVEGSVDKSYGIQVANLAGLPVEVINRAKEIIAQLEESDINKPFTSHKKKELVSDKFQISLFGGINTTEADDKYKSFIEENIKNIDINSLTPMDAMNLLNELVKKSKTIG